MDAAAIIDHITTTFADVRVDGADGDSFFMIEPETKLPFATLITRDNDYDGLSKLARGGIYRLSIGVSKDTYRRLFGEPPSAIGEIPAGHDYAALDRLLPQPIYGALGWVCVLNPGPALWEQVEPLLAEAYALSRERVERRQR